MTIDFSTPASKEEAYKSLTVQLADLNKLVVEMWLSRPPIPEAVDTDMQKMLGALHDFTTEFEKETKLTVPKEVNIEKEPKGSYIIKRASDGSQLTRSKQRTPPSKTLQRFRHSAYTEADKTWLEKLKFD